MENKVGVRRNEKQPLLGVMWRQEASSYHWRQESHCRDGKSDGMEGGGGEGGGGGGK